MSPVASSTSDTSYSADESRQSALLNQIEKLHEAAMVISVVAQQSDYSNVDRLIPSLSSWKVALNVTSSGIPVGENVGLEPQLLIDYLIHSQSQEIIDLVCDILEKLLANEKFDKVLERYQNLFVTGLQSPSPRICQMTLALLRRSFTSELTLTTLLRDEKVMSALIGSIASDEMRSLELSINWLIDAASRLSSSTNNWLDLLFTTETERCLQDLASRGDVFKFRVFEVLTRIAILNDASSQRVQRIRLMSELTTSFNPSKDLLSTLNVIEVFTKMIESRSSASYLNSVGVLQKLADLVSVERATTSSMDAILVAACVKFIGFLYFHQKEDLVTLEQKFLVLDKLVSLVEADVPWDLEHEVWVCVANIGSTVPGLALLNSHPKIMNLTLEGYHHAHGDRKVVFLRTSSCFFGNITEEQDTTRPILTGIFHAMRPTSQTPVMETLLHFCKSSLLELQTTAFSIVQHLTEVEWGLLELCKYLPVLNYLLERGAHFSKETMEWKFSILNGMVRNGTARGVLGDMMWQRVLEYVRKGPYYVEVTPQVSMESV